MFLDPFRRDLYILACVHMFKVGHTMLHWHSQRKRSFEVLNSAYSMVMFSKTLNNTCEHKIKSFAIEEKHFNKSILYTWSVVHLVNYIMNGTMNKTTN